MVGPGFSEGEATMAPEAAYGASMVAPKARCQQKVVRKIKVFSGWRGAHHHITTADRSTGSPCIEYLHRRPRFWLLLALCVVVLCVVVLAMSS